jgi:hypothetical protein
MLYTIWFLLNSEISSKLKYAQGVVNGGLYLIYFDWYVRPSEVWSNSHAIWEDGIEAEGKA